MAAFNEPTQWTHPLGNNADVATLPDDTSGTSGRASLQKLFQLINQTPLEAGGIAPEREDFNALFKVLGDSIFYAMNGGLWSYNSAFDYPVGRVVLYTDGNLYKCIQANDNTSPKAPTDSAYWSKIPLLSDFSEFGFNTGDLKPITSNTIPNSWLLGNGATVNRSICPNLVQFAYDNDLVRDSTEQASYESDPANFTGRIYGAGDGSTTIQIPDFRGRSIMGALSSATVGRYQPEQLPNITGYNQPIGTNTSYGGVFSNTNLQNGVVSRGDYYQSFRSDFNAHNSNSIYTDDGHVYPKSIALNFIIKT
jgi:hypothetical protein